MYNVPMISVETAGKIGTTIIYEALRIPSLYISIFKYSYFILFNPIYLNIM